ncbi:TetR/AcrR family transcriptional regulator [Herbiconiux sp. CPCC 205716]|uniref:TetR/AcrR family transcriptional regulator n=1 Tax=Herbiconiux gentiana TaxID=2970912 RepID=A0ABT2GEN2_9MICO|nr:TetR/AcrR family transcriptional regulator [Herbiconiux gentiana]MCS5714684.1 TetR/AcrR family transcriptional regulator [Herbiconiux gentiana]
MSTVQVVPTRVPRRRSETRKRLLEATQAILLDGGAAAVTVDSVTTRAGYTRGAFYSNFTSIDDLVFGLYGEHMAEVLDRLSTATERVARDIPGTLKDAVEGVVAVMPFDVEWLRIRINFASQARHDAILAEQFVEQEQAFRGALQPVLVRSLAQVGLEPTVDADEFTRAVIAAHNGALANSVTDPDPLRLRVLVCTAVILSLTRDMSGLNLRTTQEHP